MADPVVLGDDLLLVNRGGVDYCATVAEIRPPVCSLEELPAPKPPPELAPPFTKRYLQEKTYIQYGDSSLNKYPYDEAKPWKQTATSSYSYRHAYRMVRGINFGDYDKWSQRRAIWKKYTDCVEAEWKAGNISSVFKQNDATKAQHAECKTEDAALYPDDQFSLKDEIKDRLEDRS